MDQLLNIRHTLIKLYKNYEIVFNILIKFIFGFMVFSVINTLDYGDESLYILKSGSTMVLTKLLFSLIFAIVPISISYIIIIGNIALRLTSYLEISIIILLILLCIWLLYVRIASKESWLIILTVMAFYYKIPYLVPILAGLYTKPTSVIPVAFGCLIYLGGTSFIEIGNLLESSNGDIMAMAGNFPKIYTSVFSTFTENNTWIIYSFLFSMIIIEVYFVAKQSINYAKEIAICVGGLIGIVGIIVLSVIASIDTNIILAIISCTISVIIGIIVSFFDKILDYNRSEKVSFEDDENYYYVKIIPKVDVIEYEPPVNKILKSGGGNLKGTGNRGQLVDVEEEQEEPRRMRKKRENTDAPQERVRRPRTKEEEEELYRRRMYRNREKELRNQEQGKNREENDYEKYRPRSTE